MRDIPGAPPPSLGDLTRAQDRLSFVYLERCVVHRDSNAITAKDERGVIHIPAASLGALLLGPGTNVSHQAMVLLAESGATAVWVGEQGVRYYAHGRTLTQSSRLLEAQARLVTNQRSRLTVARTMYSMRFPEEEDTAGLSMQQLRGREGARVKRVYRAHAARTGVEWSRRDYDVHDFASASIVNQALSAANTSLYGVVHAVIVALGCSPGLGFVHTGHERSFVYDIADLYKAEVSIPAAFDVAADPTKHDDVPAAARHAVRDRLRDGQILLRCVRDVRALLLPQEDPEDDAFWSSNVVSIWDGADRAVSGGVNHEVDW
ncbi:type I-E CRISPR-associated endonuclease Cas1e [uncultured Aeromicrobium sp.]|uniref:type I-E CRISPR-associated endonuclease Cas1e n=1 Tax=uncultured Aeromicrobium sp. TaxID=337820 RepID=UPI0025D3576D|nr:type I-E CRISPR-associated endonuclease Cas1e [uncultured Aeromicrobium sp.]